jgi:FemAB-related protein (PEP-CTERM system-associated)
MISVAATTIRAPAVSVETPTFDALCDEYVKAHPMASSYHRPPWMRVINRSFGHQTKYLTAQYDGRVVGVLPLVLFSSRIFGRYAVSIPFVNYGGIVADSPEIARALLDAAVRETRRVGGSHLELRHTTRMFNDLSARQHKVAMHLRLEPNGDQQWQALDRKLRNQVRKAERERLVAEIGGAEQLSRFYEVFARNMRDLGTPVYAIDFFRNVLSAFSDTTRVFVVSLGGRAVAAAIVHWHRDSIEVPWASSIRDFNSTCANVLMYWHMLRFAAGQGFRTFDFGRSTPGGGTFHFKRQWGAEPKPLVWEYWTAGDSVAPNLSPGNPKFALAIKAWRWLPVPVATALGPSIVRHIP